MQRCSIPTPLNSLKIQTAKNCDFNFKYHKHKLQRIETKRHHCNLRKRVCETKSPTNISIHAKDDHEAREPSIRLL